MVKPIFQLSCSTYPHKQKKTKNANIIAQPTFILCPQKIYRCPLTFVFALAGTRRIQQCASLTVFCPPYQQDGGSVCVPPPKRRISDVPCPRLKVFYCPQHHKGAGAVANPRQFMCSHPLGTLTSSSTGGCGFCI